MEWIFVIHLGTTCFMGGLCWFVQIVHYPLFHQIDLEKFPAYERKNYITGFITVPVMTIEVITGFYLLYHHIDAIYLLNTFFLGLIWLSTMIFQVPIHLKLIKKATSSLIEKLILTNWIRTISWSARIIILGMLLFKYLEFLN